MEIESKNLKLYKFNHWTEGEYEIKALTRDEAMKSAKFYYNWGVVDMEYIGECDIELCKRNNNIEELKKFLKDNVGRWVHMYYTDGLGPSVGSADGTEYYYAFLGDDPINGWKDAPKEYVSYDSVCSRILFQANEESDWWIKLENPSEVVSGVAARIDGKGRNGNGSVDGCAASNWWYWGWDNGTKYKI